jgi:hypothetical protein
MPRLLVRPILFVLLLVVLTGSSRADITLIGVATLPGNMADLSGLKENASDGTPQNRLGGLSGMAYTGRGHEYLHIADRGPKDGASDYVCRFHRMEMRVSPGVTPALTLKLIGTTLLTDEQGRRYIGALEAFDNQSLEASRRLDPEGVVVGRDGTIYISDEYGPVIYEFDTRGQRQRSLPLPARFRPRKWSKSPAEELPPHNTTGRQPNRGMEGLAISPDGTKLYGIMQSPLIQDGGVNATGKRTGLNCRLLEVEIRTGKTREFVYPLDHASHGLNEILAVNDQEFLVIERDGKPGKTAGFKKIMLINITGATDVSGVESLPAEALPKTIVPVKKKTFLNLLDERFKIVGDDCPEKFEGLVFGPDLPDGRHLLFVTADNDFIAEQPLRVYAFAIDKTDLPGYQPQQFAPRR